MSFAENGWAGLEPQTPEQKQQQADEQHEIDMALARAFKGPSGRMALAWLRDMTIEASGFSVGLTQVNFTPDQQIIYHEGQRDLVRHIERRIRRAAEGSR